MLAQSMQLASRPIWWPSGDGWRRTGRSPIDGRRAVVRAAARAIVAEQGMDGVRMRQLAARSSMCVQTLYNNFGNRDAIVLEAISEFTEYCLTMAGKEARATGVNGIFVVGDFTTRLVENDFKFMHELLRFMAENDGHPVQRVVIARSMESHRRAMLAAQAAGCLRPWVDCELALRGVHKIMLSMLTDLVNCADDMEARTAAGAEYRLAIGSSLLGVLQGRHAARLEQHLALDSPACGDPAK